MATATKDFRVKAGLVVEGATATVEGHDVLTKKIADAKGDLLVGTADNAISRLGVGANGYVLTAASGETSGLAWAAPVAVGVFDTQITFEGATADDYETTLTVVDPTADRTITLPNVSGTVVTSGDTGTVTATMLASDSVTTAKITNANVTAAKLAADAVETAKVKDANITYAKIQNVATGKVLGRVSANAGVVEEIATTGTGDVVRATSPTLVTPTLGAATATTINKVTITMTTTGLVLDGIKFDDTDNVDINYGLISRTALATPIQKSAGEPITIEYYLVLGFNE